MAQVSQKTNPLLKALHRLAQADVIFFLMPFLMLVLIIGTVSQQSLGLHDAHQKYFASLFFWFGPLPLPGGHLIISLMSVSLLIKFIFFSDWKFQKSGIILTHLGALILLIGGIITAASQREFYMVIPEREQTPYIYDYFETETVAYQDNKRMPLSNLPFKFEILESCDNCDIQKRENIGNPYDAPLHGMARFMALLPKKREPQAEANLSGITAKLSGAGEEQDGIYVAFQFMPKPIEIQHNEFTYQITHGKKQRALPFSIYLDDFQKSNHPGTMMARAYTSDLIVKDGDIEWPYKIEMNKPLRYKGFTFYQSSFEQTAEQEITILSVVENKGRLFPYIGTFIIALGMLLHLLLKLRKKKTGAKA